MNKNKALVVLFLLIFGSAGISRSQTATVTGSVFYKNMRPAANCTVSIADKFAFTDVRGRFRISNVPFGEHTLQITRNRKKLKEQKVLIRALNVEIPRIIL